MQMLMVTGTHVEQQNPGNALSNMIATSHVWLFKLKLIKIKCNSKFSSSVTLAIFQGLNGHMWPGATILDNTDVEHFHHCRKPNWTAVLSRAEGVGNITPKV